MLLEPSKYYWHVEGREACVFPEGASASMQTHLRANIIVSLPGYGEIPSLPTDFKTFNISQRGNDDDDDDDDDAAADDDVALCFSSLASRCRYRRPEPHNPCSYSISWPVS